MTNSTPKTNSKVEKQSPKPNGQKRIYSTGHRHVPPVSKNPPINIQNSRNQQPNMSPLSPKIHPNHSPPSPKSYQGSAPRVYMRRSYQSPTSRLESPRGSPTNGSFYAGAKFSEPPSPASLPKPPVHWTTELMLDYQRQNTCEFTNHLKFILNVKA